MGTLQQNILLWHKKIKQLFYITSYNSFAPSHIDIINY